MPANGPTAMNDITTRRLCDALKRGNSRMCACALARCRFENFRAWMRKAAAGDEAYTEFALKVRDAEGFAEDEAVLKIREGSVGWQGAAWWLQRRNRIRWGDAMKSAPGVARGANDNSRLADVSLEELESAIQEAAELKRRALEAVDGKKETG